MSSLSSEVEWSEDLFANPQASSLFFKKVVLGVDVVLESLKDNNFGWGEYFFKLSSDIGRFLLEAYFWVLEHGLTQPTSAW